MKKKVSASQIGFVPGSSSLLLYTTQSGKVEIEVRLENETVWLTQADMAQLFQTTPQNITIHLKAIYNEGELKEPATCKEYLQVQIEGNRQITRQRKYYSLEAIIAVGYRVRSHRGVQFRNWATERLNEYLVKGFTLDDERLKAGTNIGSDYFDEMLERIRDIRTSEKRFYQKIRDIYKLAVDYEPQAEETQEFFKIVQSELPRSKLRGIGTGVTRATGDKEVALRARAFSSPQQADGVFKAQFDKLHYAVTGKTAAELISERADAEKDNMGLTSWKGDKVRQSDVTIAKNYLNKAELEVLNRIILMYLDFAEDQAKLHRQIFMRDWRQKLDAFLKFNEREILDNPGKVTRDIADKLALSQYEIYHKHRLQAEAQAEAIMDDTELKKIEHDLEEKSPK